MSATRWHRLIACSWILWATQVLLLSLPNPGLLYAAPCDEYESRESCGSSGGLFAGGEIVFFRPRLQQNEAISYTAGAFSDLENLAFNFSHHASPRVWLGYENSEGLGVRSRYFYYDDGDSRGASQISNGNRTVLRNLEGLVGSGWSSDLTANSFPKQTMIVNTGLRLQTWDLEGTQALDFGRATVQFAGGIRYANTESWVDATVEPATGFGIDQQFVNAAYRGWGPTFAIDARRRLSGRNVALKAGLRASALAGELDFVAGPDEFLAGPNRIDRLFRRIDQKSGLFIGEVSIGVDWTHAGRFADVVLGAGWEGQYWNGLPLATRMGANFDDPGDLLADGFTLSVTFIR